MAESFVSFLVNQLTVLLREEHQLLGGIKGEVEYVRDELEQLNEFLRIVFEKDGNNSSRKEWIKQLTEIAYDIEDVLDKHMPRRAENMFMKLYNNHKVASQIPIIKKRLHNVSTSQQRYRAMHDSMDQGSSSTLPKNEGYYDRGDALLLNDRGDALLLNDDEVVGIEKPKEQLLEWIHSRHDGLEVISVVGMGGLGKTTLVKKVYDDPSVRAHFNHHVWIVTSEYKDVKHLLTNIIEKLLREIKEPPPKKLGGMNVDDMREFLYAFLKEKNYIIVLDEVWDVSTWDAIRFALPKRGAHGCIIITTRFYRIGNVACIETDHVYELKPLQEKESWELFQRRAFPRNSCPDHIREYAEKILKRCEGLPLAISVIGGLLATKDNRAEEWERIEHTLGQELVGGSLGSLGKSLFTFGYNDLPYFLKDCYLYLCIFPKDGLLEKERIIRLWIAESFVQPKEDKTAEEVAVEYINDLFSRSLIQVAQRHVDGRVRAFRIHDLIRDYIISESRKHNIVTIYNGGKIQWPSRIRRLAIQNFFNFSQDTLNLDSLRSLVVLISENIELGIIKELVGRCRLLKVLDLSGAPLETIPNEVFKLYNLKHMSLRNTRVKIIPKSIKYLVNLETLDLKNCNVTELPIQILELHKLRNLLVYKYSDIAVQFDNIQSFKAPCDIARKLPLLFKLSCIDANESNGIKMVREIGKLTQLQRLGIAKLRSEDGMDLCSSIAKLTNLCSLRIDSAKEGEKLDLDYSINLHFLRSLTLKGCIERVPEWIRSLNGLTTLGLYWSRLREDPLDSLQDLPNLAVLRIHGAYIEGLKFKAQGFKKLKELWVRDLKFMKWVIVEKGSMPSLEEWTMKDCKMVMELPQGIEHLRHLKLLVFGNMRDKFVERVAEEVRNEGVQSRLAHVANVRFGNSG